MFHLEERQQIIKYVLLSLLYRGLSEIWSLTGTPAVATVVLGLMAALAALIIQLDVLVEMMSIGKNGLQGCRVIESWKFYNIFMQHVIYSHVTLH